MRDLTQTLVRHTTSLSIAVFVALMLIIGHDMMFILVGQRSEIVAARHVMKQLYVNGGGANRYGRYA